MQESKEIFNLHLQRIIGLAFGVPMNSGCQPMVAKWLAFRFFKQSNPAMDFLTAAHVLYLLPYLLHAVSEMFPDRLPLLDGGRPCGTAVWVVCGSC